MYIFNYNFIIKEEMRFEVILRMLIKLALAEWFVANNVTIMKAFFTTIAENGIFEVARNRFSKCYRFQDINYTTTNEIEQIDIFERYCKFLNSLDVSFKITINNKNKDMEQVRDFVFLQDMDDGFNHFRKAYNDIMEV